MRLILTAMAVALLVGCSDGDDDQQGDGGMTATGTCESTCTKSIALNCPNGVHSQTECVASCNSQQTSCRGSGMGTQFQTYLDCIQSTPMVCGQNTMAPTSNECVAQGLAVFQCSLAAVDGGI